MQGGRGSLFYYFLDLTESQRSGKAKLEVLVPARRPGSPARVGPGVRAGRTSATS